MIWAWFGEGAPVFKVFVVEIGFVDGIADYGCTGCSIREIGYVKEWVLSLWIGYLILDLH